MENSQNFVDNLTNLAFILSVALEYVQENQVEFLTKASSTHSDVRHYSERLKGTECNNLEYSIAKTRNAD
jgi:hypothetical protein